MDKLTIQHHLDMKKRYSSYPSLPKHLTPETKEDKAKYNRLVSQKSVREDSLGDYAQSTLRGFILRVNNWSHNEELKLRNLMTAHKETKL